MPAQTTEPSQARARRRRRTAGEAAGCPSTYAAGRRGWLAPGLPPISTAVSTAADLTFVGWVVTIVRFGARADQWSEV